jgi:hypothetical protein
VILPCLCAWEPSLCHKDAINCLIEKGKPNLLILIFNLWQMHWGPISAFIHIEHVQWESSSVLEAASLEPVWGTGWAEKQTHQASLSQPGYQMEQNVQYLKKRLGEPMGRAGSGRHNFVLSICGLWVGIPPTVTSRLQIHPPKAPTTQVTPRKPSMKPVLTVWPAYIFFQSNDYSGWSTGIGKV